MLWFQTVAAIRMMLADGAVDTVMQCDYSRPVERLAVVMLASRRRFVFAGAVRLPAECWTALFSTMVAAV